MLVLYWVGEDSSAWMGDGRNDSNVFSRSAVFGLSWKSKKSAFVAGVLRWVTVFLGLEFRPRRRAREECRKVLSGCWSWTWSAIFGSEVQNVLDTRSLRVLPMVSDASELGLI